MLIRTKKILFVFNTIDDFIGSRLSLIRAVSNAGYKVEVAMPDLDKITVSNFPYIIFHKLYFNRKSINPWCQLKTVISLQRIFSSTRPDIVHIFRLKLNLYGAFLAKWMKIPSIICVFTGLGYLFTIKNYWTYLLRNFVVVGFRLVLAYPNIKIVFQNNDDKKEFLDKHIIKANNAILIKGSGVNLNDFNYTPEPVTDVPVILLLSRMLWDKGIKEYIEAAKFIKAKQIKARFLLVGDPDLLGITSISIKKLQAWHKQGAVEWRPAIKSSEIPALMAKVNIICLLSYYREGLPRVLMEGAACGRALITTDVPGCREAVKNGENGLLVPAKDYLALAEALILLIQDAEKRQNMGKRSRTIAEQQFSVDKIIAENLKLYKNLLV